MRSFKAYSLVAAAAMLAFTGCKSSGGSAKGERSDRQITAQIKSDLSHDPVYKFNEVDVKTFGGVVQLGGFVNSEDQKRRATWVAQNVSGVKEVQNGMALKSVTPSPTGRTY